MLPQPSPAAELAELEATTLEPLEIVDVRRRQFCADADRRRGDHAIDEGTAAPATETEEVRGHRGVLRHERLGWRQHLFRQLDSLIVDWTTEKLSPARTADTDWRAVGEPLAKASILG